MLIGLIIGYLPIMLGLMVTFFYYKKLEPAWFQLFPWFFLIILIFEFGGYFYSFLIKAGSNHFIYNLNALVEFNFYLLIYYLATEDPKKKRLILLLFFGYILSYAIFVFALGSFFEFNSKALNSGKLFVVLAGIIFLSELLMKDSLINFFSIPMFWITTGITIAALGNFLYFALFDFILKNKLDPKGTIHFFISIALTDIEYSLILIGLLNSVLWPKRK